MRLRMKRMLLAVLAAAMSLVLSGCFVKTVDELYTLPKHSDEYNRLEQAIDQVMSSQNASYTAPVSGMNQQSVQLADLDGDGMEEAVAFLKTTLPSEEAIRTTTTIPESASTATRKPKQSCTLMITA